MRNDALPEPADLIGLAAELEREGQYNAAKLLRAAAESLLLRASFASAPPRDAREQAAALEEIAGRLAGPPAPLAAPLRAAARAVAEGTVALIEDTPDPYVCRLCGEVSLDSNAERCPHCGQWGTARSRIRPIYWMRESTPGEAVDRLRRTAAVVRGMLADPSDPRWQQPSVPGEWTAHQVLEHLHNAQRVFRGRIDQLVAGGEPLLTSVMVWTIESGGGSTAELLDAYSALRAEIVGVLEGVSSADWWNRGRHEEWGVVTLAEQASYFANHEPTHLGQLAAAIGDGPADH